MSTFIFWLKEQMAATVYLRVGQKQVKGATVKAVFKIGNGEHEIAPGSTLRFIIGKNGESGNRNGGGGGGTAVLLKKYGTDVDGWAILMVGRRRRRRPYFFGLPMLMANLETTIQKAWVERIISVMCIILVVPTVKQLLTLAAAAAH